MFEGVTAVQGPKEDALKAWIQAKDITSQDSLTLFEREAAVKASIHMNAHEEDPVI